MLRKVQHKVRNESAGQRNMIKGAKGTIKLRRHDKENEKQVRVGFEVWSWKTKWKHKDARESREQGSKHADT